jgi:hypothetical protein
MRVKNGAEGAIIVTICMGKLTGLIVAKQERPEGFGGPC